MQSVNFLSTLWPK